LRGSSSFMFHFYVRQSRLECFDPAFFFFASYFRFHEQVVSDACMRPAPFRGLGPVLICVFFCFDLYDALLDIFLVKQSEVDGLPVFAEFPRVVIDLYPYR
jgi:hypothetical protein